MILNQHVFALLLGTLTMSCGSDYSLGGPDDGATDATCPSEAAAPECYSVGQKAFDDLAADCRVYLHAMLESPVEILSEDCQAVVDNVVYESVDSGFEFACSLAETCDASTKTLGYAVPLHHSEGSERLRLALGYSWPLANCCKLEELGALVEKQKNDCAGFLASTDPTCEASHAGIAASAARYEAVRAACDAFVETWHCR